MYAGICWQHVSHVESVSDGSVTYPECDQMVAVIPKKKVTEWLSHSSWG